MRRREFIGALAGGLGAWRMAAHLQERMSRIGILLIGGSEPMGPFYEALRARGYLEGRNIQLVVRSAQGDANRLSQLATELVGGKVDVIVASLTPSAIAAKNATRDIPIVMAPVMNSRRCKYPPQNILALYDRAASEKCPTTGFKR